MIKPAAYKSMRGFVATKVHTYGCKSNFRWVYFCNNIFSGTVCKAPVDNTFSSFPLAKNKSVKIYARVFFFKTFNISFVKKSIVREKKGFKK